jgi:hypothetical protein
MSDSRVEGQPHLSNDLKDASPDGDLSNPHEAASTQEQEGGHVASAERDETGTPGNHVPLENKKSSLDGDAPAVEESTEARIERLGRQRPEVFGSIWAEIGFVFSISMSQVLTV